MKKIQLVGFTAGIALFFASCEKKDTTTPTNPATGTPSGLSSFFSDNVGAKTQHFTINATNGGTIYGEKGTLVCISPQVLTNQNGAVLSGDVNIELVEIYDRATMVLLNKPTMGLLPNGDKSAMTSKGEYYLRITQNGQEVHANNGVYVVMPGNNIPGSMSGMSLFHGEITGNDLTWIAADSALMDADSSGNYVILDNHWGWTNVDKFSSYTGPKTTLKVKLPAGYDNTNSEVFLAYDGEPGDLASLDVFTSDGYFSEHYGQIPIGIQVHFIAVTMINGQLNYSIHAATITDGYVENIADFAPTTQADLAALINALP